MNRLSRLLYNLSRKSGRNASRITDFNNIRKGRVDKVMKKRARRSAHRSLSKVLRKLGLH